MTSAAKDIPKQASKILVIDVGGTHVKLWHAGEREPRKIPSGPKMTATQMVRDVQQAVEDVPYDFISIGYPGPVLHGHPMREPYNLGSGWVGFDFAKAFGHPVRVVNDAAMQALGSYHGKRMLFLGLGTGLGSAMIVDGVLEPMELGHLPYKNGKTYEDYIGIHGFERLGKKRWRRHVEDIVLLLKQALNADYVVLGGGNARDVKTLPADTKLGNNRNAFTGGVRLWKSKES